MSTEDYLVGHSSLNAWRNLLKNYSFIHALGDTMFTRMDGPHAVQNEVLSCQRETGNTHDQQGGVTVVTPELRSATAVKMP